MMSVNDCINYSEDHNIEGEAQVKFIREVILDNVLAAKEFFASEEYTPLAIETYDRIRLLTPEELASFKIKLEKTSESGEHNENDVSKNVLIKLIEIVTLFKDIEFMLKLVINIKGGEIK